MDPSTVKALLMLCAYQGATAVLGNLNTVLSGGQQIPVNDDPLVQDAGMQAKGLAVYAEAKVQYAVLVQAFEDSTGIWPNPVVPGSTAAKPATQPAAATAARPAQAAATGAAATTAALQALASNPNTAVAQLAQQILQLLVPVQAAAQAAAVTGTPTASVAAGS